MTNENINASVETAGSATAPSVSGEGQAQSADYDTLLKNYKDLESKMSEQGNELGEYRKFVNEAYPILEKLGDSPELLEAIREGKIDDTTVKQILSGTVTSQEGQQIVQAATKEANKEGKSQNMTEEQIDALVNTKAQEALKAVDQRISDLREEQDFKTRVDEFVSKTPDLKECIGEVQQWLEDHNSEDLEVAYYAVKGQISEREARKKVEAEFAENAKGLAANAAGGSGSSGGRVYSGEVSFDDFVKAPPESQF